MLYDHHPFTIELVLVVYIGVFDFNNNTYITLVLITLSIVKAAWPNDHVDVEKLITFQNNKIT